MAYGFGQGINPQLGAIDYSPIMRGAQSYAQGTAAGAQNIAQGIQSAGSSIGGAIQQYGEQKKQTKMQEGQIKSVTSFLESVQKIEGIPEQIKAQALSASSQLSNPKLSTNERFALSQGAVEQLTSLMQLGEQAKQAKIQSQAAELQGIMGPNGKMPSMVKPGAYSPEAQAMARQQILKQRMTQSEITLNEAQAVAAGREPVGRTTDKDVLYRDLNAAFVARNNRPPTPQEQAEISNQVYGAKETMRYFRTPEEEARAAELSTIAKSETEGAIKFLEGISDAAKAADESSVKYNEINRLLDEGGQTGFGQDYLTGLRSLGTRLGFKDADLQDQQKMEALMAEDALIESRRLLSGQGSVTESERARVDKVALDARKNKASLKELIGIRNGLATRSRMLEIERLRLEDAGVGPREAKKMLRKWLVDNPAGSFMPAVGTNGAPISQEQVRKANSILTK